MEHLLNMFEGIRLKPEGFTLATSSISVVSHEHGRQRRGERNIERRELQEAIKHGKQERANPSREGKLRWRYTHKGVVYITDETSRHEITSWRMVDGLEAVPAAIGEGGGAGTAHVVLVVDMSGSMRKDDVPGYKTRNQAVYGCLAKDLVEPQLKLGSENVKVSLIEMSDGAELLLERVPMDRELLRYLNQRGNAYARSHGNYLPALDAVIRLMAGDAGHESQLFLIFLSDGAPSDHNELLCPHGVCVWQPDLLAPLDFRGKHRLQACASPQLCRGNLCKVVAVDCLNKIKHLGDLLGRDRIFVNTVAFGPPGEEDYVVLQSMAGVLPRSTFQKLGLSAAGLQTHFTSLTSTLTTMRTETFGKSCLRLRADISQRAERKAYEESHLICDGVEWDLYTGPRCKLKQHYDANRGLVDVPFFKVPVGVQAVPQGHGLAHNQYWFGQGAERLAFQCTEVMSADGGKTAGSIGPRLVAKQTRFTKQLADQEYHRAFMRTQGEAEALARRLNLRLAGGPDMQVHFLACWLYQIIDIRFERGEGELLVEQELDGHFTKWNNNNGAVSTGLHDGLGTRVGEKPPLIAIVEEDEEEQEGEAEEEEKGPTESIHTSLVPQCFSHFTYVISNGRLLVCDLQGVWNASDGFTFTDPVIHSLFKTNGATDKGPEGMRAFFKTHVCNDLCRRLGQEHTKPQ